MSARVFRPDNSRRTAGAFDRTPQVIEALGGGALDFLVTCSPTYRSSCISTINYDDVSRTNSESPRLHLSCRRRRRQVHGAPAFTRSFGCSFPFELLLLPIGPLVLIARGLQWAATSRRDHGRRGNVEVGLVLLAGRAKGIRQTFVVRKAGRGGKIGTTCAEGARSEEARLGRHAATSRDHETSRHQVNVHRSSSFSVHAYNSSANASFFASNIIRPGWPTGS